MYSEEENFLNLSTNAKEVLTLLILFAVNGEKMETKKRDTVYEAVPIVDRILRKVKFGLRLLHIA